MPDTFTKLLSFCVVVIFLLFSNPIQAQPANDICDNSINIDGDSYCSEIIYTNIDATSISITNENPFFQSIPVKHDVWFSYIPKNDNLESTFLIKGKSKKYRVLNKIRFGIYTGDCSSLTEILFAKSENTLLKFITNSLEKDKKYFIRIDGIEAGGFEFCIDESTVYNIAQDNFSSKCSGVLYDSGGEFGSYSEEEDYIFTICPESGNSINFTFDYYNIGLINEGDFSYDTVPNFDYLDGDKLTIHNGKDTSYSELLEINGNALNYEQEGTIFGGGVKYSNCTNSDCITLHFISDDTLNYEGFVFRWECDEGYCETVTEPNVKVVEGKGSISNYLFSKGLNAKLVNIKCDDKAIGVFENIGDDIGVGKGIILTSGLAVNSIGPNAVGDKSEVLNSGGDDDLDSLSAITGGVDWKYSADACVVEVDVVAYSDEISYKYVFGSEEYDEFVNNDFNDVFALFISGKGIDGNPKIHGQKNMALIPNTNDFVSINSVNGINNWQYYHSNIYGNDLEYDGLVWDSLGNKNYLVARAKVTPCETYHLKFAIADRGDTLYDSGVFIGEIKDGRPDFYVTLTDGFDDFSDNCDLVQGVLTIELTKTFDEEQQFYIEISGTAKKDEDYTVNIPDIIVFEPGEVRKDFKVNVILDDIVEGTEYAIFKIFKQLNCGKKQIGEVLLKIEDEIDIEINGGLDTLIKCKDREVELIAKGANYYHWKPENSFDNPDSALVNYYDTIDSWAIVRGRLFDTIYNKCFGEDSVFIKKLDIEIIEDSVINVCENELVLLTINKKLQGVESKWYVGDKLIGESDTLKLFVSSSDVVVYVDLYFNDCPISDSIYINVINYQDISLAIAPTEGPYYIGDTVEVISDVVLYGNDSLKWFYNGKKYEVEELELSVGLMNKSNQFVVEVKNEFGCNAFDTIVVNAEIRELLFPNAIILGDEKNSIFTFYKMYSGLEILNFQIFNRWGEKVYDCDNNECAEKGWDATYKSITVPPGVYLYRCSAKTPDGTIQSYRGQIIVLQ